MGKGSILIAVFLLFIFLSNLVQESHEITGILIPQRSHHRCRRSRTRRGRTCRRRNVRQLRPVFMLTEREVNRRNFFRYTEKIPRMLRMLK